MCVYLCVDVRVHVCVCIYFKRACVGVYEACALIPDLLLGLFLLSCIVASPEESFPPVN